MLMTQDKFIERVINKPWVNRSISLDHTDCYGLVILYYKHVLGVNLAIPDGYKDNRPIYECWESERQTGKWKEVNRPSENGLIFTAYRGNTPLHVGLTIDRTRVLHCRGTDDSPGKVEIHRIATMRACYGRMTFHKYIG